jgi:DNA-binding transcriptional ArsR family regulator
LALVAEGYTAKEIGRKLGISDSTVDNHLFAATQLLSVDGRKEAGRLYANYLRNEARQQLPSQPEALAVVVVPPNDEASTRLRGWRRFGSFLPPIGGMENALTPSQTFLAICRIAFLGALAFIACVMIIKMTFQALN